MRRELLNDAGISQPQLSRLMTERSGTRHGPAAGVGHSAILTPVQGPNDGMVSLASAVWGELWTRFTPTTWPKRRTPVFLRAGEGFDTLRFYRRTVENRAGRGFGDGALG